MASVISQLVVLVQLSAAAAAADAQAVTFDADALNAAAGSRQTRRYPDTLVCFFDRWSGSTWLPNQALRAQAIARRRWWQCRLQGADKRCDADNNYCTDAWQRSQSWCFTECQCFVLLLSPLQKPQRCVPLVVADSSLSTKPSCFRLRPDSQSVLHTAWQTENEVKEWWGNVSHVSHARHERPNCRRYYTVLQLSIRGPPSRDCRRRILHCNASFRPSVCLSVCPAVRLNEAKTSRPRSRPAKCSLDISE